MSQIRDLDTQTVRCIHCGDLVKFSDRNHWRACAKHPARAAVEEAARLLALRFMDMPWDQTSIETLNRDVAEWRAKYGKAPL